jgi:hypothetical protein
MNNNKNHIITGRLDYKRDRQDSIMNQVNEALQKATSHQSTSERDYKAIESLVVDNPDLERLELLLEEFNMFEAIGAVWQESRHSDLLAFLLNPQQNHGIRDAFVKMLLQKALLAAYDIQLPVSPIDLDVWDLDQVIVLRESQRIDILLLDERHRMAVIIENQLTGPGNGMQLQRYRDTVGKIYPGWSLICIYLTPDGEPPPDKDYISLDYGAVCELIERLVDCRSRSTTLNSDVVLMLNHYTEMLRRHIVGESEITRLSRRIYARHQRAFDLIYEHRLNRQKVIRNVLKLLIEQKQGIILDHSQERYTGFTVSEWDVPALTDSKIGERPRRMLVFEFDTWNDTLPLRLHIGAGSNETRQKLLDIASSNQPPFLVEDTALTESEWIKIFERKFLTAEFYEQATTDELAEKIVENWANFIKHDLPDVDAILKTQEWIWKGSK